MDENIIHRVLAGYTNDFDQLIEKYYNELFVFIHNQVNDIEMTKDVLQEVFMRLYQKLNKYDSSKASFRTWMYRVTSNYTISYLKRSKYYIKDYDLNLVSSEEDILAECVKRDDVKNILSLMKKILNKNHYQMMILHFFSDLSDDEISKVIGVSKKTVQNTISLSIKKIKEELGGETYDV